MKIFVLSKMLAVSDNYSCLKITELRKDIQEYILSALSEIVSVYTLRVVFTKM